MLLPIILPCLLQKYGQHADMLVMCAVLGVAVWDRLCICSPSCSTAQVCDAFCQALWLIPLVCVCWKLSKELQWDEVHSLGFALLHSRRRVLRRFWSNSKFAAAQRLYQGKACCMRTVLKCPLMKWGLTFCDIKKNIKPEFNISWEIIFHNLMPGALFFLIWRSEFWSLLWFA